MGNDAIREDESITNAAWLNLVVIDVSRKQHARQTHIKEFSETKMAHERCA